MERSCSACSELTLAKSLCTVCNKWFCYRCTDAHQHQRMPAAFQCTDLCEHQRPRGSPGRDLHPRETGSLPLLKEGSGSYPCSLLMCHSHRQEPLELFCESCDLLCCGSCHLSSHKNHKVVQLGKALQDQQWLFESLMAQVEERRSAVENNAKQLEDRVHGIKIAHRKAENQIKMAKMIMMNELNKRANLLIEQLEKIAEDFQQCLEEQLQGAIEMCGQLDHVQKFITWAKSHHCRGPVLFSRTLISLQMQQLLESSLPADAWSPVKIKFNWDASYWTKQISSLGHLIVEGGNCTYPQGLACSTILRPQPIPCLALPSVCHRGREAGCGFQTCCEAQMCCLHGLPSQTDLDSSLFRASVCNPGCVQPTLLSAALGKSQTFQSCKEADTSAALQTSSQGPTPSSPAAMMGPAQLSWIHGPASQQHANASQSQSEPKSFPYHQLHREALSDSHAQPSAESRWPGQSQTPVLCRGKVVAGAALHRELSHATRDPDSTPEESWEETSGVETRTPVAVTECRELLDDHLRPDKREQNPSRQQQPLQAASIAEPPRTQLMLKEKRNDRRSASLEASAAAPEIGSDVNRSGLSPSLACARRTRRSQSIPAQLVGPSASPYGEKPAGCTHNPKAGAADKYADVDPRQRRASDGVLCVVKETASDAAPKRGHQSTPLSYKTEPDPSLANFGEDHAVEKCRVLRKSHSGDPEKDPGRQRVPVVCLERLKILISQLPPHGRRQSDPLPASAMEKGETVPRHQSWNTGSTSSSKTTRTTHSVLASPNAERHSPRHQTTVTSEFDSGGRCGSRKAPASLFAEPQFAPVNYSRHDLDSDARSASERPAVSSWDGSDDAPQPDSDTSLETGLNEESSSEVESEHQRKAVEAGVAANFDPSLEYDTDPKSASEAGSVRGRGFYADSQSGDAEAESDVRPEYDAALRVDTDSDAASIQALDSQGSAESEIDIESEPELTADDPQPLRSDLEEDSPVGPGQRPLLVANPDEVQPQQDGAEMESEDFCAVCLIGGELLCCDRCPKVFHLSCHIPPLLSFPSGDWLCSLCRSVERPEVKYDCENERTSVPGLSPCDQRKCERLTLLILSNILSAPFHEPVSPLARHYYQIIKRPMDLSVIRAKLNKTNAQHYKSPEQFVADVCLMFHNCAKFNYPDSEVAQAGCSLEVFFTSKLAEVFPGRVFAAAAAAAEMDSDSDEYDESCRMTEGGFPWPERREQCYRKRKRRNSLKSRKHNF